MRHYKLQVFITLLFMGTLVYAQHSDYTLSSEEFQKQLNESYYDAEESPLEPEDLKNFEGLEFFEIDEKYKVKAKFVRTPAEPPFVMKTSTDRLPIYVKYGELYFSLNGKDLKLNVYQSQDLGRDPEYANYLFIPFTDLSNGDLTYDNGRYLDFQIPEGEDITLDFNKAYNPYCAYSGRYSCPVPPKENFLETEILAGVKAYKEH
ncbi:DUF1684 domain-containing protein [Gramella sp. AN32]|uniref:DUF1684 domain-containing protein n=1 Tax=Christiangramia antarctica TaxID=2058158 RepID=A0ABW5X4X2_9FLAO|nr:DUF1684 domain-containing protein [Gramella sp. AN32]MCM4158052.1 hypothetical protein [Gramella sp. AN32]